MEGERMKNKTCGDCRHYQEKGRFAVCTFDYTATSISSACEHFSKPTLFDRITQSPEVLAEKSVYQNYIGLWCSPFIQWGKDTKAEAIAATVARLKEVCDGN
jgi:hypothetical protein